MGEGKYTVCTKRYVRWQIWEYQVTGGVYTYMHGNLSMLYSKGGTDEDRIIQGRLC